MRKRGRKIKRYGNIYQSGARSAFIAIAMLAGLVLFSLIGWTLYTPVYNWLMRADAETPPQQQSAPASTPEGTASAPTPVEEIPLPPLQAVEQTFSKGIYLPPHIVTDFATFTSTLQAAARAGYTDVMVDAKDALGEVLFITDHAVAANTQAVSGNAYTASEVSKAILAEGLVPVARLHAFRDDKTARQQKGLGVTYYDTETVWLDNAPELGGHAWLNPYSLEAQTYISDLAGELIDAGFANIVLESVHFPTGVGRNKAGYGKVNEVSRQQILKTFVQKVQQVTQQKGGSASVYISASVGEAENAEIYGGSPYLIAGETLIVGVFPGSMPSSLLPQGESTNLTETFHETVRAIAKQAKEQAGETGMRVLVQAYLEDGALPPLQDGENILIALQNLGVEGCILYNPLGKYRL